MLNIPGSGWDLAGFVCLSLALHASHSNIGIRRDCHPLAGGALLSYFIAYVTLDYMLYN